MKKPKITSIVFYLFIRYIIFFIFLMIKDNNAKLIDFDSLESAEDWFYHLWIALFLPIVSVILFSIPLYLAFKTKKAIKFFLIVIGILIVDYFMYVFFTSNKHIDLNGIYNAIISSILLAIFFRKSIVSLVKANNHK